ncbi:MAG: DUF1778 domain-containing protein [Limnohabitans sp.]|jgi:uncharacterized protein (DUF1778 family)
MKAITADNTEQKRTPEPIPAIEQEHDIRLSQVDQKAFAKALLSPEPPNSALRSAMAKANEFFG